MAANTSWLAVTIPVFLVSLVILIKTILGLTSKVRGSVVASVPIQERATLTLDQDGEYDLYFEGKRFSRDFVGLEFSLRDRAGTEIALRPALMRTTVSGFSSVRMQLLTFHLAAPGPVTLRVSGGSEARDPANRIVIGRPITAALFAYVLALVALGALTIASFGGSLAIYLLRNGPLPR